MIARFSRFVLIVFVCVYSLGCENFTAPAAKKKAQGRSVAKASAQTSASLAARLIGHWQMTDQIIFDPGSYVRLGDSGDWAGKNPVRKSATSEKMLWGDLYITTATKPWTIFARGFKGDFVHMRASMSTTNAKHRSMGVRMWSADEGDSLPTKARKYELWLSASGHMELHKEGDTWVAVYEWVDESTEP